MIKVTCDFGDVESDVLDQMCEAVGAERPSGENNVSMQFETEDLSSICEFVQQLAENDVVITIEKG